MHYRTTIQIFAEVELDDYLKEVDLKIEQYVNKDSDNYIMNVNETEFINYIFSKIIINPLQIEFDLMYMSNEERMILAEDFPSHRFDVYTGESYPRQVFKFHIPFVGDSKLLKYIPNPRLRWSQRIYSDNSEGFYFEIIECNETAEQIRNEAYSIVSKIRQQLENQNKQIESFNNSIRNKIQNQFICRKEKIIKKNTLLEAIDIPIKKNNNVSSTFSVPSPQLREKIIPKPMVTEKSFVPDPTLDNETYKKILQMINDVGKQFERMPSIYAKKEEEHLRDHFLMILEPNFEGSATGETFNKRGKTDILLRYENSNVFIGECKFWRGEKVYLSTISQLLSYLTWRDSKAAVIMFVTNKDFSSVVSIIKEVTKTHDNYLGYVNNTDETWFNYRFHINEDKNREVKLAVMLYHIPK